MAKKLPPGVFQCAAGYRLEVTMESPMKPSKVTLNRNAPKKICDPNVGQIAGYFKLGTQNKNYFFWFFESRNKSDSDPVVLWMTGGPGCSSEVALFAENGPCKVNPDGNGTVLNPYSWNEKASVIFIDQPAGTGFSYGDHDHNEESVSTDMYLFLTEFMKKYSKFASLPFYVFGESYAGHYVPATGHRIWRGNKENAHNPNVPHLNLQGVSVGNGLTDPEVQYAYYPQMAFNSSTAPARVNSLTYHLMRAAVNPCTRRIHNCNEHHGASSCLSAYSFCNQALLAPYMMSGYNQYDMRIKCQVPGLCYDFSNVGKYLGREDVLNYLGVKGIQWKSCAYDVTRGMLGDWMRNYQTKFIDLLASNIRVLIYAGDVDFICNYLGNEAWVKALKWPGKEAFNSAPQKEWTVNGKKAGKCRTHGGLTFLQVYQAGHMVPMDQPEAALNMLDGFIHPGNSLFS